MLELFTIFFKLGLFTIGGGIAMIPILRDEMVNKKKWFTDEEMVDIITVCQGLPGVIAVNMATYVGFRKRGFLGSLVATIGVVLPSFVIILIIAAGMNSIEDNPFVQGALGGLRACAAGLVIVAAWQVGRIAIKDWFGIIGMTVSFILIVFFKVGIVVIVPVFLALGVLRTYLVTRKTGGEDR